MLRLRTMSRPDFKHSIISSSSSPLWKYPSPSYVSSETETFLVHASFLNPSQTPSSFYFLFKVTLCLPKTSFQNFTHRLFWFFIKNISYYMGICFQGFISYNLCPWNQKRFNKTEQPSEKLPYSVTPLHTETSPVHRADFTTATTFIYVVTCISIHCKRQTELYCVVDFFLKCNISRHGISLISNNTFSAVFITRRIEMDSIKDCSTGLYNE